MNDQSKFPYTTRRRTNLNISDNISDIDPLIQNKVSRKRSNSESDKEKVIETNIIKPKSAKSIKPKSSKSIKPKSPKSPKSTKTPKTLKTESESESKLFDEINNLDSDSDDSDFIVNDSDYESELDEKSIRNLGRNYMLSSRPSKRRRLNNDFDNKCYMYNLPYELPNSLAESQTDIVKYSEIYQNVQKDLVKEQIDIMTILQLTNILDSERTTLIEKYSLMINSENDLSTYLKLRSELKEMITYYSNSDINDRIKNQTKKAQLDMVAINTSELENKILNLFGLEQSSNGSKQNLYIQGLIYQKYKKLTNMSAGDNEYYKLKDWLDTAVQVPLQNRQVSTKKDQISQILAKVKEGLDAELYGMEKVKEELLMAINQRLTNPSKADTSIALVGPPGVGKTKIISVLANTMEYPFEHISMGGINDSSFLAGHSYTYEGAKPGKLVDALTKMKCNNGILFFDEIDKIADTSNGKEVSNQLLHITDFTQNDHFCDKYMPEIPIDLSKIWFIFSLNSITDIDPILANRLNFIQVDGYTTSEKQIICKTHLLPKAYDKYKLSSDKYIFSDQIIMKIIKFSIKKETEMNISDSEIEKYKSGIRELKRSIDHIFDRLSLLENMSNKNNNNQTIISGLSFYPEHININQLSKLKITDEVIDKFLS
jgi:ATP-dependent Lon protease